MRSPSPSLSNAFILPMPDQEIEKASGQHERFSEEKLIHSLSRSGVPGEMVPAALKYLKRRAHAGMTTQKIHEIVLGFLRKKTPHFAARFHLRRALMELGPSGYPFEKFVGGILERIGYRVQTGVILQGACVTHEVDIVGEQDGHRIFVECKFHNNQKEKCNVRIPLYIYARSLDLKRSKDNRFDEFWLVTNTKFTTDAVRYGACVGLKLISWNHPAGHSLKDWVEGMGIFPITCLTTLQGIYKKTLIAHNIVLVRQLAENEDILEEIGLSGRASGRVLKEALNLLNRGPA